MNRKITRHIVKNNRKLNIEDHIITDEITQKAENTYQSLINKGYNEKDATNGTIKSLAKIYDQFHFNTQNYPLKYYNLHKLVNILLLLISLVNYLLKYIIKIKPLWLIIIDIVLVSGLYIYKRHLMVKENKDIAFERKNFLMSLSIAAIITIMVLVNKTIDDFYTRIGFTLFLISIVYFLFNGVFAKRLFLLTIPTAIYSTLLNYANFNYIILIEIFIFIFLFYLIYLLINVNFCFMINQLFGIVSIISIALMIFVIPYGVFTYLISALLLICTCLVMMRWFKYRFTIISVKVMLSFYIGTLIGYFTYNLAYTYGQGYLQDSSILLTNYADKIHYIIGFFSLEMFNVLIYVSISHFQSYRKELSINKLNKMH